MQKRYMALWFCHLKTDWLTIRKPELAETPFVFSFPAQNRNILTAVSPKAEVQGLYKGMRVADAKAMVPGLKVFRDKVNRDVNLLNAIGEWSIRYTPFVVIDAPDGLLLDISGCTHLWGGETTYYKEVVNRFLTKGYTVRAAIADTIGAAWAIARFAQAHPIVAPGQQSKAIMPLPPAALRLENAILERLDKLGFRTIKSLTAIPISSLRRRFGEQLVLRLKQATGEASEYLHPLQPVEAYAERLPCLEPILTRIGIELAIRHLLQALCKRLAKEGKGIRAASLKSFRIDGHIQQTDIGTNQATYQVEHLFKLFELKIGDIEPDLGIELFTLEAFKVDDVATTQEAMWADQLELQNKVVIQLLDRLAGKIGAQAIHRYLPQEHHWPERSIKKAENFEAKPATAWRTDQPRPTILLPQPELVEVSAPIPDYPPMLFRYQGTVHHIKRADGPERIEREWWLDQGEHRDYYIVEDQHGQRYWIFRLGHYGQRRHQWFIHGFFA